MTEQAVHTLVERQRAYFRAGATLDVDRRLAALSSLKACVQRYEDEIALSLGRDLGKSGFEGYMCETGLVLEELSYMQRQDRKSTRLNSSH